MDGLDVLTGISAPSPVSPRDSSAPVAHVRDPFEAPRPRLVITPPTDVYEAVDEFDPDAPVPITEVVSAEQMRDLTGLAPLDHVLGGGLVRASYVLLASPRGIGKSTLSLQMLAGLQHRCLYVTGEETREQLSATAARIGARTPQLYVHAGHHLGKIFAYAQKIRAQTIVIDSIQKMKAADVGGRTGSPTQLKECSAQLLDYKKTTGTTLWVIGHVTNDGDIAGPEVIEHDVDVILELTKGDKYEGAERILKCLDKNRHGPSDLVGHLRLTGAGLVPVDADGWDEEL